VGAAGVVAGIVGGELTIGAKNTVNQNCDASGCLNSDGLDAQSRGKTWSAVSNVGFIVGAAGLAAGGAILLLTPSAPTQTAVAVQPAAGGAEVRWIRNW
jgi:hypothetical protein